MGDVMVINKPSAIFVELDVDYWGAQSTTIDSNALAGTFYTIPETQSGPYIPDVCCTHGEIIALQSCEPH